MKSRETSSVEETNRLLNSGWRIYRIDEKERKIIFWLLKDEKTRDEIRNAKRSME